MKIIIPPSNKNNKYKKIANKGCDICPYCNSTDEQINYLGEKMFITTHTGMMLRHKGMFVARYKCKKCGAEWQSEPY